MGTSQAVGDYPNVCSMMANLVPISRIDQEFLWLFVKKRDAERWEVESLSSAPQVSRWGSA
jgi:hypothetical protein